MNGRRTAVTVALILVAVAVGWWGRGALAPTGHDEMVAAGSSGESPCPDGAEPLYWKAPMDPTFVRDAPGKSPMGMDLVPECPSAAGAAPPGAVIVDSATVQNIGVRTAPNSMAINLNVKVEWWDSDRMWRSYMNVDNSLTPRYEKTKATVTRGPDGKIKDVLYDRVNMAPDDAMRLAKPPRTPSRT